MTGLGDFGGPTRTVALLPGSPAIDAAAGGAAFDQRGIARTFGSAPDVGAFESRSFTLTKLAGDGRAAAVNAPFSEIRIGVTSDYDEPVVGGRITLVGPASAASIAGGPLFATVGGDGKAVFMANANCVAGTYAATASAAGASAVDFTLTNQPAAASVVATNVLGPDGVATAQRSRVMSMLVTFDNPVDPTTGTFTLVRVKDQNNAADGTVATGLTWTDVSGGAKTAWRVDFGGVSFAGLATVGGSLPDGVYELAVDTDLDGGPARIRFLRLFGDANGNGRIDNYDRNQLRLALASFSSLFDLNGNGRLDNYDLNLFRQASSRVLTLD